MKRFLQMMSLVIISLTVFLSILIVMGSQKPFVTVSLLETQTYVHISNLDTFDVHLLASEDHPIYFDASLIISASISSEKSTHFFPVEIESIEQIRKVDFDYETFYDMRFKVKPIMESEDYTIMYDNAQLTITYVNQEELIIPLGSFSYHYPSQTESKLYIYRQHVIHDTLEDIPTAVGMVLGIENRYQSDIRILSMSLNAPLVDVNIPFIRRHVGDKAPFNSLESWLGYPYDLYQSEGIPKSISLEKNEETLFVIPFKYDYDALPLFHFPLIIVYEVDNTEKVAVINDFLYINTDRFLNKTSYHIRTTHD